MDHTIDELYHRWTSPSMDLTIYAEVINGPHHSWTFLNGPQHWWTS